MYLSISFPPSLNFVVDALSTTPQFFPEFCPNCELFVIQTRSTTIRLPIKFRQNFIDAFVYIPTRNQRDSYCLNERTGWIEKCRDFLWLYQYVAFIHYFFSFKVNNTIKGCLINFSFVFANLSALPLLFIR